jgi:hypothetical protein
VASLAPSSVVSFAHARQSGAHTAYAFAFIAACRVTAAAFACVSAASRCRVAAAAFCSSAAFSTIWMRLRCGLSTISPSCDHARSHVAREQSSGGISAEARGCRVISARAHLDQCHLSHPLDGRCSPLVEVQLGVPLVLRYELVVGQPVHLDVARRIHSG